MCAGSLLMLPGGRETGAATRRRNQRKEQLNEDSDSAKAEREKHKQVGNSSVH